MKMTYDEARQYIKEASKAGIRPGLSCMRELCRRLGNPQDDLKIIHIAGTNGKGSVCAFMTSVLKKAGFRTGTFISPHLVEIRERFLINGELVENGIFEEAFREVKKAAALPKQSQAVQKRAEIQKKLRQNRLLDLKPNLRRIR